MEETPVLGAPILDNKPKQKKGKRPKKGYVYLPDYVPERATEEKTYPGIYLGYV